MFNNTQQEKSTTLTDVELPANYRQESAVQVESALHAVAKGVFKGKKLNDIIFSPHYNRRHLRQLFIEFQNELYTFDTTPLDQCRKLATEMVGLENVLPRSPKSSDPHTIEESMAICTLYYEAIQAGMLDEFVRSHPESEAAFGGLADKAVTLFKQSELLKKDSVCRDDFLVGCMLLVNRFLARWSTDGQCLTGSSVVGFSAILSTRFLTSFSYDLIHKYSNLLSEPQIEHLCSHLKRILAANIKAYSVPAYWTPLQTEILRIHQLRELFPDLLKAMLLERRLPTLTQHLCSCNPTSAPQFLENRVLPFGIVALADHGGFFACYDGIQHTFSASLMGGERKVSTYFGGNKYHGKWITTQVHAVASLDDRGKIFLKNDDRHRPPPQSEKFQECREALCSIDGDCYKMLENLWTTYPQIIGQISKNGPYLFFNDDSDQLILFCPNHGQSADIAPQESSELLAKYNINFSGEAVGLILSRGSNALASDAISADECVFSTLSRRDKLSFMRNQVGEKFTYDWLLKRLTPLGVKEERDCGKGSHWGLVREELSYTTSQNFRERPQFFRFLPEILDALEIEYEDFLRQC